MPSDLQKDDHRRWIQTKAAKSHAEMHTISTSFLERGDFKSIPNQLKAIFGVRVCEASVSSHFC